MAVYKHGTYGEFVESIGGVAAQGGNVPVYVGLAPVNLVRGFAAYVNSPVKLTGFGAVRRYMGYSDNWASFDLCEAFHLHFDNADGNIGPIVAINVLDPATCWYSYGSGSRHNTCDARCFFFVKRANRGNFKKWWRT